MQDLTVDVEVLKDAIRRVDISGFNTELEKTESVTDLTEEEWSELVAASKVTIECDALKTIRKKDEKFIFLLLLEKLVFLSSAREKLTLTERGFADCRAILDGGYGLEHLCDYLKNPAGYCLRYFLNRCGPTLCDLNWKQRVEVIVAVHLNHLRYQKIKKVDASSGAEKIKKFQEGCISFNDMWSDELFRDEFNADKDVDKVVVEFLLNEFGLDFFPILCREFSEAMKLMAACSIEVKEQRMQYHQNVDPKDLHRAERKLFAVVDDLRWWILPACLRYFEIFIKQGVRPWFIERNGTTLFDFAMELKKQIGDKSDFFKPIKQSIEATLTPIRQMSARGMREVLCVWTFGKIPFFSQIPRDVMKMIGKYVVPEKSAGAKLR